MAMVEGNSNKLHVLFLPYFTPSHSIPLVNAARVFAGQGVKITILTTKYNAALFQSSVDRDNELGRDISVHSLKFPAAEMGLPEGVENFPAATTMELMGKVYMALPLLQKPMEDFIQSLNPHCIFSDMFFPWTVDLAEKMGIPRIMFYVNSFISHCLPYNLEKYEPHKKVDSESESFLVPGLPDKIEMKRSQMEEYLKKEGFFSGVIKVIKDSELRSFGLAFDNFDELEPQYADYYQKLIGTKIWNIGPLFYFANKEQITNGSTVFTGKDNRLNWLDAQEPQSVLYVSFGSIARFSQTQINEIAAALEASNKPFIWVVRKKDENNEQESWLPDGFEERITKANKGLIFKGWAPQLLILQHPAVGGFLTHCGWNSILEALTAGVPLITWPLFAEQFYNEKIIGILKVGISLGWDHWNSTPVIEEKLVMGSLKIEKAINRLLCDSEESQEVRKRAKDMAVIAKKCVEVGGSSYQNLLALIHELKSCAFGDKRLI